METVPSGRVDEATEAPATEDIFDATNFFEESAERAFVSCRAVENATRREMVALLCSCEHKHEVWGELWWVGGEHDWVFFDYFRRSGTRGERLNSCPGCGKRLERRNLAAGGAS